MAYFVEVADNSRYPELKIGQRLEVSRFTGVNSAIVHTQPYGTIQLIGSEFFTLPRNLKQIPLVPRTAAKQVNGRSIE